MILLWGLSSDEPMALVRDVLRRMGAAVAFLDQRLVLETTAAMTVGTGVEGWIRVGDDTVDFADVRAVYLRPYPSLRMPSLKRAGPDSVKADYALGLDDLLLSWLDITPAFVVNRPSAMASNTSKPYQAELIRRQGLSVPPTLVTTDPRAVTDFVNEHGQVIYKSVSSTRSIVRRLDPGDTDRLADVIWCPTQFQKYLEGRDVRVHIVGRDIFACAIDSGADDYRYPGVDKGATRLQPFQLPENIAQRCQNLAAALKLPVAGVDLRCVDDEWYCFEVNPAPGFSYFQAATGHPIDSAIARLLIAADDCASEFNPQTAVRDDDSERYHLEVE